MRSRLLLALAANALFAIAPATALAQLRGMHGIASRNGLDVWAVGDSGVAYRSLNSGASWASVSLGVRHLRAVAARNMIVVVAGDSGKIWQSGNWGQSWSVYAAPGAPDLNALAMVSDQAGFVVGADGTILKTTDSGLSWSPLSSGTSARLNAVAFTDALTGWAVGEGGTVLSTVDGGGTWNPVALGTNRTLYSVAALGTQVWIVGAKATAFKSENGGGSWTPVNLKLDLGHDVNAVSIRPGFVYLAGGGGFIRWTADGGATWSFANHELQVPVTALSVVGNRVWAASDRTRTVISSANGGAAFTLPTGAMVTRTWSQKLSFGGIMRGRSIDINPENPNTFFAALGATLYRSLDAGETWTTFGTPIPSSTRVNAFRVSPRDSNVFIAAVGGIGPKRLVKSDDGGQNWYTTLEKDFGDYGIPLEIDPDRPDTVYFGADNDGLYRSVDGGKNWARWSTQTFRSPCDIISVPDSGNVILVGDGITGLPQAEYFKSTDWGQNFILTSQRPQSTSEIPGMACSRLRKSASFGTNWGSGGVQRSADFGQTWTNVHNAGSSWGIDIARDDPNLVVFGQYSGGQTYISFDGGANFTSVSILGSNYSFFARDRAVILAQQGQGIYKLNVGYAYTPSNIQSLAVTSPNGGETWAPGSTQNITWSSQNLVRARIEFRRAPGEAWQLVTELDGYLGTYAWSVPMDVTSHAKIRVRDAFDSVPDDTSNAAFTIVPPLIAESPGSIDFGQRPIGSTTRVAVTISNTGTGTLQVTSITTSLPSYWPGRSSMNVSAGTSDTVGVTFGPSNPGILADTLVIVSNAYNTPNLRVPIAGTAYDTAAVAIDVTAPSGGETWQYGTVHNIQWNSSVVPYVTLEYRTSAGGAWKTIAAEQPAGSSPYPWTVPFDTTDHGQVRVRDAYGNQNDVSSGEVRLVSPLYLESPNPVELHLTLVGRTIGDHVEIRNPGSAPLFISSVTSNDPDFWPGRSSLTIPARGTDTLGVFFQPQAEGPNTATFLLLADDPQNPHTFVVKGEATSNVAVGDVHPATFDLRQNEPNPFTVSTVIRYALPAESEVSLEVFNLQGQRVASLAQGQQGAGTYSVRFGSGVVTARGERLDALASGVYFYRFKAGSFLQTRKMLLLK
jgi:photosystem II stability/assembly factor-like uncharacterized protein